MANSQTKANKAWRQNNRERSNYLVKRSTAKSFVRNLATSQDLDDLANLIIIRTKNIANGTATFGPGSNPASRDDSNVKEKDED